MRTADDTETRSRIREVQLLVNVIEPDPRWQPWFLSDEAGLFDCIGSDEDEMRRRLSFYFGRDPEVDLRRPIWQVVDMLKAIFPEWPHDE